MWEILGELAAEYGKPILAAAAAAIFGAVVAIAIKGVIDKRKIQNILREKNFQEAIVKAIEQSNNAVTLEELENHQTIKIRGNGISDEIYIGQHIHA